MLPGAVLFSSFYHLISMSSSMKMKVYRFPNENGSIAVHLEANIIIQKNYKKTLFLSLAIFFSTQELSPSNRCPCSAPLNLGLVFHSFFLYFDTFLATE